MGPPADLGIQTQKPCLLQLKVEHAPGLQQRIFTAPVFAVSLPLPCSLDTFPIITPTPEHVSPWELICTEWTYFL